MIFRLFIVLGGHLAQDGMSDGDSLLFRRLDGSLMEGRLPQMASQAFT
jgi:hypothetical protein